MCEQVRNPRTNLLVSFVIAVALLFGVALDVEAQEWDPAAFAELLQAAEADYTAENFTGARDKYRELRSTLKTALDSGLIDEAQIPAATETLHVITYQLGRTQQETGDCDEAIESFEALRDAGDVADAIKVKLPARFAEAELCAARAALDEGRYDDVVTRLESADRLLSAADPSALGATVPEEQAAELETALERSQAERQRVEDAYVSARLGAASSAIQTGDCAAAESHVAALETTHSANADVMTARTELEDCEVPGEEGDTMATVTPWIQYGLMGVGGVLIITAVALEGANASDVDDYESARDACLGGTGSECQTALDLADDIETQQITTGVLVGVGVAALGGGLAWWLLTMDSDEDGGSDVVFAPAFTDDAAAATFSVQW